MIVTTKIKVDLNDKRDRPTIDAVQGDGARGVEISLLAGGTAWTVPTGTTVQIRFQKPDGTGGSYDTLPDGASAYSISGSTVTVRLAPQTMTVSGVTQLQVVMLDGEAALATFTVNLSVEPDPSLDTLDSKNYVNHISWLHGQMDKLYEQTFVDGGYISTKLDDLHGRVETAFELGTLATADGLEVSQDNRIRSGFFVHGGRQITVVIPEGVKARCFFYNADHKHTSHSGFYDHTFTIYNSGAYARCVAAYSDNSSVSDAAALADKVAIFYHSDAHDAFQGSIRKLGYTSFAECTREGYYQFAGTDVSAISDAPAISVGGILEAKPHGGTDVVMQTIRTTTGEIWFRWGSHPFRRLLPREDSLRWYALGDSITQGYYSDAEGLKLNASKGWAALAAKWNNWALTNYGVGGSGFVHEGTVGDRLNARGHVDTIDFSGADLVTLAFGVNDWKYNCPLGSMEDDVTAGGTVYSNMRYVLEKILSDNPHAKIVVISPINCCAYGDQESNWGIGYAFSNNGTLEDIFNAEREICEFYGIEFVDMLHGSVVNRLNAAAVLPDGVHPSLECHKQLAFELAEKIMGVNPSGRTAAQTTPETIPTYVQAEAERVAENVLSVRTGQSFVFAAFSDAHMACNAESATSAVHAGAGLAHIRALTNLDMAAHLGDYINGGSDSTKVGSKEEYRAYHKAMAEGCRGIPTVWVEGNHDANYQGNDILTPDELYAHIGANNQGDHVVEYGNETGLYGYMDFPAKRLRVIYLNTSDGWKTGVSDAQAAWLSATAFDLSGKADEKNWGIIILMHIPVTFGDNAKLRSAIEGRSTKAQLIAIFHGHCHNFRMEKVDGIWQIGIPELCVGRNNEYGSAGMDDEYGAIFGEFDAEGNAVYYPKTSGTAEDTSFNVVTIDRSSKTIYCHCFGAGYDRVVSYAAEDVPAAYTNLFSADDPDFVDEVRFNSSGGTVEGNSFCSGYIAAVRGDVIRVYNPNADYTGAANDGYGNNMRCLCTYDSSKAVINTFYPADVTLEADGKGFAYTIVDANTAFIRVASHPIGDYHNFVVTKNEEIN